MDNKKELIALARHCIAIGQKKRPEVQWLQSVYERFYKTCGVKGKANADRLIYEKMYHCVPERESDTLKIRYWRTGHHTPTSREQCISFGKALNLDEEEMNYLIQQYFDRSDQIFDETSADNPEYIRRKADMDGYIEEYLIKVDPTRRMNMRLGKLAMRHYIRHLYFSDALQYIYIGKDEKIYNEESHIQSINYDSELTRNFNLIGEIPRKTMIRHLLLLGMPYVNRQILDERLISLGYLPLQEEHTLTGGEYLDWLLIQLLDMYQIHCQGEQPEVCSLWFQEACRILDEYFQQQEEQNLRFMYFKALKE